MKLMIIAVCTGTLLSGAAPNAFAGNPSEEAKQEAEVLLYSLSASWNEFQHANEAIVNSQGNHGDIEVDYQYFYQELNKDNGRSAEEKAAAIQKLKKTYAKKHKQRAAEELQKQERLASFMELRIAEHQRKFKAFKAKYKNVLEQANLPEVEALANKLNVSPGDLRQKIENYQKTAAQYDDAYEQIKKGFV